MSYDLTVYAAGGLQVERLREVVESLPGLSVGDSGAGGMTVVHCKRERHAFTVFGPRAIDAAHVPDVVSRLPEPATRWHVTVEGGDHEVRPARRFAKALALAADGVVVDEQTDDVIGPAKIRKAPHRRAEPVRVLDLRWYSSASAPDAPSSWIQTAKSFLPEALPRRFGNAYPLPYRLDRDGEERFISTYCDVAWFDGAYPCLDGGLYPNEWDGIVVDRLKMLAGPLDEAGWRDRVRRFFVEYARARGSVLATGEVLRNHPLGGAACHGRDLSGSLRGADGILGLPAQPVWWTWVGEDYLPLVVSFLPAAHTTFYDEGALYAPAEDPADRGQLASLPDPFPKWLRAVAVPSECGPRNAPAAIRPIIGLA
ncbi:hypothetical protein BN971_03928 [Mycobacterium bohemicum DSM 44277]|uniref:Uncharacterized protein n=2 Tax=Mycobacterium bohemicum TaxID=56425 RepID=A0A1X1R6L3_MYCBE|nr:hypothetical protein [Mycobacterium bohemicum]MCV6970954.1 hypothetical protein [Mycobacterium bohemicum]ORV00225.1 hypothetical protein AWB93_10450 [Mycobacterium bohemicum]CPR12629.1 hypothetical protein BN971_03928 [Mycobacterium bohemicum DSM 44277]